MKHTYLGRTSQPLPYPFCAPKDFIPLAPQCYWGVIPFTRQIFGVCLAIYTFWRDHRFGINFPGREKEAKQKFLFVDAKAFLSLSPPVAKSFLLFFFF
jgi:hypothetical protein